MAGPLRQTIRPGAAPASGHAVLPPNGGPDRSGPGRRCRAGAEVPDGQSRCLLPLLSTRFQRLAAFVPPLPENRTGSAEAVTVVAARPAPNVSIGALQLSRALVVQDVPEPVVGVLATPKMPCARLSDPYEVEM